MITLGEAIALAADAHKDQIDKNGVDPYILHPLAVMDMVNGNDTKIVAVLHDVLEDTDLPVAHLLTYLLTKVQLDALMAVTHTYSESYESYVKRALVRPISAAVKVVDHLHNSNPARLAQLSHELTERLKNKYLKISPLIREAYARAEVRELIDTEAVARHGILLPQ
jgi:(p)ppGpp synthase/HD superfamily hydrolase